MKTVTLAQISQMIRDRAEVRSGYVSASTLTTWINGSYAELYDLLVSACRDWFISESTLTVVSGTASYALPATFYRLVGVDVIDGSQYCSLRRYNFAERNVVDTGETKYNTRYRVMGTNLYLSPTPNWSGSGKIYYIPAITSLAADADTLDGVNGWEEFIVLDCLIKHAALEESDPGVFMDQKKAMTNRVNRLAYDRDDAEPDKIRDVHNENQAYLYGIR